MPPEQLLRAGRRSAAPGDLRRGNLSQILRYVRDHGPSSRQDIARGCGLGISTLTDLVVELRSRRLVRELAAVPRAGAGRPTRPIALDGDPWCVLGVQVDLLAVRFLGTTVGGRELFRDEVPVRLLGSGVEEGYALLREALCHQLRRIPAEATLVAVHLGLPGYVAAHRGTVSGSNALGWADMPLQRLVYDTVHGAGYEDVAVGVAHDCHLAALHAVRRELDGPAPALAVYLGGVREIGGAVVVEGEIFQGADGGAGDFGHVNVHPDGPLCSCGRRGCLGSMVSLERLLVRSTLASPAEARRRVTDDPFAVLHELGDAAAAGHAEVLRVLADAGTTVGAALDDVIGALNPHVVVLGGYFGALHHYVLASLRERIAGRLAVEPFAGTRLVALEGPGPRVVSGAALAASDSCLQDPLTLTQVL